MFARIARFENVDASQLEQAVELIRKGILSGEVPEGLEDARGYWMLADRERGTTLGITLFESEDGLRRGDEALNRMTPAAGEGQRTSVEMYEVVLREDGLGSR